MEGVMSGFGGNGSAHVLAMQDCGASLVPSHPALPPPLARLVRSVAAHSAAKERRQAVGRHRLLRAQQAGVGAGCGAGGGIEAWQGSRRVVQGAGARCCCLALHSVGTSCQSKQASVQVPKSGAGDDGPPARPPAHLPPPPIAPAWPPGGRSPATGRRQGCGRKGRPPLVEGSPRGRRTKGSGRLHRGGRVGGRAGEVWLMAPRAGRQAGRHVPRMPFVGQGATAQSSVALRPACLAMHAAARLRTRLGSLCPAPTIQPTCFLLHLCYPHSRLSITHAAVCLT
mgnify:CR=1 FL=1